VAYRELRPPPSIAAHVACLWVSDGPPTGPVLPDGCVDVVWTGRGLVVAGPSTQAFTSGRPDGANGPVVGVRFRVGAAGAALRTPMHELRDSSPHAADLWRDGASIADRIAATPSAAERLDVLTAAVTRRLAGAAPVNPAVRAAVTALARPGTRIAGIGAGLSERQLRRRFEVEVGYSPKVLARVLRLQRFLWLARLHPAAGLAALAVTAGYADQSHLGRETLRLTGTSPATLLGTRAGAAGEPELRA
jgi:Helix-turn-helix domain